LRILRIDSSAQTETSQSRRLSNRIIDGLHALGKSPDVTVRDLDERLPQLDSAWIEANTTPIDDRTDDQRKTLALSDTLIAESVKPCVDFSSLLILTPKLLGLIMFPP
jgi:FMN-dependent NADH-azoreductase